MFDFRKAKRKTLLLLRSEITPTYALLFFVLFHVSSSFFFRFSVHKRNAIICNHAEKQQQQQERQQLYKCQMGDGLIIICHLCKAETLRSHCLRGGGGENRLQIVSLARFGVC